MKVSGNQTYRLMKNIQRLLRENKRLKDQGANRGTFGLRALRSSPEVITTDEVAETEEEDNG